MEHPAYPLHPFRSTDRRKIDGVIRAFPLATMISRGDDWPVMTQVPLVLDDAGEVLRGHFDANNPHGEALRRDPRVTCLFRGPDHYISPAIYPTEQYPGWNYVVVYVRALARPMESREQVRALLHRLAELHEPKDSGYRLRDTQRNFDRYLGMVFGFELQLVEARAVFKLAQDKGPDHAELAVAHMSRELRGRDELPLLRALLASDR